MISGTVLVADDDAAIRTVLNQALSRAGHTVRLTSNAATLWRWVAEGEGDVVITDVVMPAIRASEKGAYEYLPKPFDLKELIAVVGRALAEPRGPRRAEPEEEAGD